MLTAVRCEVCSTPMDPVWAEIGEVKHPTCEYPVECAHGEPRGARYCALCRRANPQIIAPEPPERPRKPVNRDVVLVGHKHPETSLQAAQRALPSSGSKRRLILDAIRDSGDGLCDWQLERMFEWKHESASACRRSLVKDGWLRDSGRTRPVPDTGNPATVWEVN